MRFRVFRPGEGSGAPGAVSQAIHSEPVAFSSEGLRLEGDLCAPPGRLRAAAVVCHPHPLYGGDRNNNVVVALARALCESGASALRFDFRGAGGSQGAWSGGEGEYRDVLAALAFQRNRHPDLPLWLAGYSFGAALCARAAREDRSVARLVLVAPPLSVVAVPSAEKVPTLLVVGDSDSFCAVEAARAYCTGKDVTELVVLSGADHFFRGYEGEIEHAVKKWLGQSEAG
ncbi:MAG: alpha/beta hydrolase [Candidatus Binatia bacterium]|nr:MAG: alpha/beta hydrolase [Candidatus Binatia bacterium]